MSESFLWGLVVAGIGTPIAYIFAKAVCSLGEIDTPPSHHES